ncbi:predicted protein [Thalassiosira pseudonana CCMP1335]|uniref:Uncharacterized protein n=1 Tax=Thalassiosira pseudonana TaxID=35128 RepID=B8CAS9_THAPS|nr:predicted protein [Thalassiosira pseudonana CCMP1335]EED89734.1 predicted protein [Thalassiosira pseudonana CCMP1335]|mmetsp:Transcript_14902/g.32190  ORF Transcript_14902/g.32190 Transcript_14902/m.32190 type:complete len:463 (-) Transcript_14902:917-2305(-)|eukprot:g11083.t1 g11083   contig5:36451-37969(+)
MASILCRGLALCIIGGINTSFAFHLPKPNLYTQSTTTTLQASYYIDTTEQSPRDIPSMIEWAEMYGVQRIPSLDFGSDDPSSDDNLYAYTTEDIPAGSAVLFIPTDMFVSSSVIRSEFGQLVEAEALLGRLGGSDQYPLFYIFVKILYEYSLGEESGYFQYLNGMPRRFDNGAAMTPFCYECLPPLAANLAMAERVQYINFNQALREVDFIEGYISEDNLLTRWAYNVARTRSWEVESDDPSSSVTGGKEMVMLPLGDMFNHGTDTEVEISYDEEGNCVIYTTVDVEAGSPLRMSYGDPTNPSKLFAKYGFLDETSPATFCKMMNIRPSTELRNIGFSYSRMLFYKDTGEVAPEVFDVLLYVILGEKSDRTEQRDFYNACISQDEATKSAYHQQYAYETSSRLKEHVDSFLDELDELSTKAQTKSLETHPRIPLILAHNEFVKQTFLKVKGVVDDLVAQSSY